MRFKASVFFSISRVLLILFVSLGSFAALANTREIRLKELINIGEELKSAILSQDIKGILKFVNKAGIFCIDSNVPFDRVEEDLKTPNSQLYKNLFGRGGMKEYFDKAKDQTTRISFSVVRGKENLRSACLRYVSSDYDAADWPEICLYFQDSKWGINDSLYNCL